MCCSKQSVKLGGRLCLISTVLGTDKKLIEISAAHAGEVKRQLQLVL